jgi:hypothetical protein
MVKARSFDAAEFLDSPDAVAEYLTRRSAMEMPHSLRGRSERPHVPVAWPKWHERLACLEGTCTDHLTT